MFARFSPHLFFSHNNKRSNIAMRNELQEKISPRPVPRMISAVRCCSSHLKKKSCISLGDFPHTMDRTTYVSKPARDVNLNLYMERKKSTLFSHGPQEYERPWGGDRVASSHLTVLWLKLTFILLITMKTLVAGRVVVVVVLRPGPGTCISPESRRISYSAYAKTSECSVKRKKNRSKRKGQKSNFEKHSSIGRPHSTHPPQRWNFLSRW